MGGMCSFSGNYLKDFLTGRELPETDDELIRQKIERMLVEEKGWDRSDLEVDHCFDLAVDGRVEHARAELVAWVDKRPFMTVKSSRGSIVSREQESVAASRLAFEVQAPLTVVANGRNAEVLDTLTGKVIGEGFDAVPTKAQALAMAPDLEYEPPSEKRRLLSMRVLSAYATIDCAYMCSRGL